MNFDEMNRNGETVLCAASSYVQKYYLNPAFGKLPEAVRRELQIMCVSITESCGGILSLQFEEDGTLTFRVQAEDGDYLFDDIESGIQVSRARREHQELLEALELYHRIVIRGERPDDPEAPAVKPEEAPAVKPEEAP